MFKIIKNGKMLETHVIYKDTCEYCGCEYEFEQTDVTSLEKTINGKATWHCPYCHKEIKKQLTTLESRTETTERLPLALALAPGIDTAEKLPLDMEDKCEYYDPVYKRCNGTRERDECYCYGYQSECTHYPEKRNKA